MIINKKTSPINLLRAAKVACTGVFLCSLLLTAGSCSVIDEDQSDCVEQAKLDYELRLVTNMTTELRTELTTQKYLLGLRPRRRSLVLRYTG